MVVFVATKKCSTCGIEKEINRDNFHAARGYRDGFTGQCKGCRSLKIAEWQKAHPEKLAAASAKYIRTDKGKALSKRQRIKHREKRMEYMEGWHEENKAHERVLNIKTKIRKKFGIPYEHYQSMLAAQNGLCAICLKEETAVDKNGVKKNLAVDHCHSSEKLRDLLCMNCNQALGKFRDSIEIMQRAIDYIVRWNKQHGTA